MDRRVDMNDGTGIGGRTGVRGSTGMRGTTRVERRHPTKRSARTRISRLRLAAVAAAVGLAAVAMSAGLRDARAAESSHAPQPQPAAQARPPAAPAARTSYTARGEFDVKVARLAEEAAAGITLGRMSLEKTFRGALVATSTGEMLTVDTKKPDSGAYAATERVTGTLDGRRGSFALVHVGTMANGGYSLSITIVPDSGTEELAGIAGTLAIDIRDGKHYYALEYTLPAS